jgi:hypothetical protein
MWRGDNLVRHTGTGKALTSYRDSNKRLGNRLPGLKLTRHKIKRVHIIHHIEKTYLAT